MFDFTAKVKASRILCEGTNQGVLQTSLGGVGRNLAEVLARLGMRPWFISAVGKDDPGQRILQHMRELGMVRQGGDYQRLSMMLLLCGSFVTFIACTVSHFEMKFVEVKV